MSIAPLSASVSEVVAVAPVGGGLQPPSADATARFAELTSAPMQDDLVVPDRAVAPLAPGRGTLGDAILDRMNSVGEAYRTTRETFAASLDVGPKEMSLIDLMRMQFRLADMTLSVEVISKGVSKFTQEVDQLTKLQ